jgi:flavodoxin
MTNTLVVYYSWTGNTKQVAEMIAGNLGAFIEPIVEVKPRKRGWLNYMRAGFEGMRGMKTMIKKPEKHPEQFDRIIIGSPVWAGGMAPPVRSYLSNHQIPDGKIAVFCTSGGGGNAKVLREMATLVGQSPIARLSLSQKDLESGALKDKIDAFTASL